MSATAARAAAAAAAPPCPEPPPAAAVARPRGGRRVLVPWRLVVGAQYADCALSTYVKVAALAQRQEGCTAKVSVLADYLGLSKSAVERGLTQLKNPDPIDRVVEVPTVRRTLPGGTGTSAYRTVRPLDAAELYVWIPVRAAEALTPRLLRAYAVLAYTTTRIIPLSATELAAMLRHHSGKRAGEPLEERQARRLVDELAALGWIDVDRRAAHQGRHAYVIHNSPLRPVPGTAAAERPDSSDGSGADDHDGSLTPEEDLTTDRLEKAEVGGGIRRRRGDGSKPVDTAGNHVPEVFGPGHRVLRTDPPSPSSTTYTGPGLQLSPRVWHILTPVRHLLPGIRPYELREIARAIGRQLEDGTAPGRLLHRLTHRYASTVQAPRRGWGRWILGAGLPRRGCGLEACESGVIWHTGRDCEVCAELRPAPVPPAPPPAAAAPRPAPARAPAIRPPRPPSWCSCPDCHTAPAKQRPA